MNPLNALVYSILSTLATALYNRQKWGKIKELAGYVADCFDCASFS